MSVFTPIWQKPDIGTGKKHFNKAMEKVKRLSDEDKLAEVVLEAAYFQVALEAAKKLSDKAPLKQRILATGFGGTEDDVSYISLSVRAERTGNIR